MIDVDPARAQAHASSPRRSSVLMRFQAPPRQASDPGLRAEHSSQYTRAPTIRPVRLASKIPISMILRRISRPSSPPIVVIVSTPARLDESLERQSFTASFVKNDIPVHVQTSFFNLPLNAMRHAGFERSRRDLFVLYVIYSNGETTFRNVHTNIRAHAFALARASSATSLESAERLARKSAMLPRRMRVSLGSPGSPANADRLSFTMFPRE
ncbi:hypothetical protein WN48_00447 [Eufriesea mexicana]|nr:hypothetical protein WN48_00447 [Eufriesea mexicana]